MNRATFQEVAALAFSDAELPSYFDASLEPLHGCGLEGFQPVTVTKKVAAAHLRGQCLMFNGEVDSRELNETAEIFRYKVHVV